jgi:hypothetical protein
VNGGPFRDLFSELPRALFDALKGIGEEAVRKAQPPIVHRGPSVASQLNDEPIVGYLCQRFGWKSVEVWRHAASRQTGFGGRLLCGHRFAFDISDSTIEDAHPLRVIDLIDRVWTSVRRVRSCYCVQREAAL